MAKAGVLLDVDGTLIDSNDQHAQAWVDTFLEAGHPVHYADVRRLIGKGGDKVLPEVLGIQHDSPEGKALTQRRGAIFEEKYLPQIRAFPGARELVETMVARGLKVAVATSSKREQMEKLLSIANVKDLLDEQASSSDAAHSKPDPDIVQAASEKLELAPQQLLMLGDTPYDIEAAGRAHVQTVALRCGGWTDEALSGAVAIYDNPADLLKRFDESPFARFT